MAWEKRRLVGVRELVGATNVRATKYRKKAARQRGAAVGLGGGSGGFPISAQAMGALENHAGLVWPHQGVEEDAELSCRQVGMQYLRLAWGSI